MNLAAKIYLDLLVATEHPEQEPAHVVASNWDLLWLLIPICGFLMFALSIENRHQRRGKR